MNTEELAKYYFNNGYNCAESVLLAVVGQLVYSAEEYEKWMPRLATGFGGGVARNGGLCGAISGAVMAIGLALGRDNASQSREPCYPAADRLYNEFLQRFGHVSCRNLTGLNMKDEQNRKLYQEKIHHERCLPMVGWTVGRTVEIISELSRGRPQSA